MTVCICKIDNSEELIIRNVVSVQIINNKIEVIRKDALYNEYDIDKYVANIVS